MLETLVVTRDGFKQLAEQLAVVGTQPLLDFGVELGVTGLRTGHVEQFIGLDVDLLADLSGALWWPERATLVVADLHLEKGSAYAAKGQLLPPYDTDATLKRLEQTLAPRSVIVTYRYVATIFKAAVRDRRIAITPCDGIRLPKDVRAPITPMATSGIA